MRQSGLAVLEPGMLDVGEMDFLQVEDSTISLPAFDLHNVEEAMLVNHRVYEGSPMSREKVIKAVRQYREFLRDHKVAGMPEIPEVPSRLVDRVWHTHICETRQYADDCHEYFGQPFHHSLGTCERPRGA